MYVVLSIMNISWHVTSYYVKLRVCVSVMIKLTFTLHHLVSSLDCGLTSSTISCLHPLTGCTREPTAVTYNIDHKCTTICDWACENRPSECKLHLVIFSLISAIHNVLSYFCKLQKKALYILQ